MVKRIRWLILSPLILVSMLIGSLYVRSFIDRTPPEVNFVGIVDGGSYAHDIPCAIAGSMASQSGPVQFSLT